MDMAWRSGLLLMIDCALLTSCFAGPDEFLEIFSTCCETTLDASAGATDAGRSPTPAVGGLRLALKTSSARCSVTFGVTTSFF